MVRSLGAVDLGKMRRGLPQSVGHGTGCILSPPHPHFVQAYFEAKTCGYRGGEFWREG